MVKNRLKPISSDENTKTQYSSLNFILKSTFFSIILTFPPIILLIVIWKLSLIIAPFLFIWIIFTLFWNFFSILKLPDVFNNQLSN